MLAISNELIVSGANDHIIKIWDLNQKKMLKTLIGHRNAISSLCVFRIKPN